MKNKDKYDLTKLTFKIEGENNPSQVFKILDGTNVVFEKPILLNRADLSLFLSWLEEECKPTILTEKEKDYLSAIIKPWKNKIKFIEKFEDTYDKERILIWIIGDCRNIYLPQFEKGKMYKGIETDKEYTLEDLGL